MKKAAEIFSTCACGEKVKFNLPKPSHFEPSVAKATCACGTRYMLVGMIDKASGKVALEPQVLEVSDKAYAIMRDKLKNDAEEGA